MAECNHVPTVPENRAKKLHRNIFVGRAGHHLGGHLQARVVGQVYSSSRQAGRRANWSSRREGRRYGGLAGRRDLGNECRQAVSASSVDQEI